MEKIIDARGLSCPQPVILTKQVLDQNPKEVIITVVDNPTALENVTKLAKSQGYNVEVEERAGEYHISMTRLEPTNHQELLAPEPAGNVAILLTSNLFGQGDEELGKVLMKSFLYALTEMEDRITNIIFMNSAVFLTTEGSEVIDHLAFLESHGVEILSCGTCLDFYQLKDKLLVGKVTNMYTAMDILTSADKSISL
jgi:selenium metabolism protein YedF